MLILTRKLGEDIAIGDNIRITLLDIKGKHAKIGVEAPAEIPVHRGEIYQIIQQENFEAALFNDRLSDIWGRLQQKKSGENTDRKEGIKGS
jgi:carbon storage regulator